MIADSCPVAYEALSSFDEAAYRNNFEYNYYWESLYEFFRPLLFVDDVSGVKDTLDVKFDFDEVLYSHIYRYEGLELTTGERFEGLDFTNVTVHLEGKGNIKNTIG